ncbi:GntR family transcriptional regulator [Cellulomonas hominis]
MSTDVDALVVRVRALLTREELRPGERVGDERGLAAALGVPRTQLRQALERLERAGVIRRTIGRGGGILVADGRLERNLNTIEGLPQIARYQGVRLETRVLRVELTLAGPRDRRLLHLDEGSAVHQVLRLRIADDRSLSLELTHLPADLFPGLADQDLSGLYRTLETVYGITPVYSDETLQLALADDEQAAHLGVDAGSPLIVVQRTAVGSTGRPIELAHEFFVGNRMRFHLHKYGYTKLEPGTSGSPVTRTSVT